MITDEQRKISESYIGGSNIAAVLGLSNFKTQLQLWSELTGLLPREDISGKMQVRLGNKMEAVVAEVFEEDTGKKLHRVSETFRNPKYPYLVGHIDRRVVGERAIVEIKAVSAWSKELWKDGNAPQEYLIQLMWYMGLTNTPMGYLVALIGNQELAIVPVNFDKEVYEQMVAKAVKFWEDFVIPKVMPTTITKDDGSTLYQLFPISDPNKDIVLTDETNIVIEQINSMTQDRIALDDQIEQRKNELKAILGDNESGRTGNWRVTWKTQNKKEYVVKASSTRVLRYSQIKEG